MTTQKIKLFYLFSLIDKALINEVIADHFARSAGFDFGVILMKSGQSELEEFLKKNKIRHWIIHYAGKTDLLKASVSIYRILRKERPHILNANLLDASLAGLPAAWLTRIPVRILSRHHSDFHHVYHPHFVKYDRLLNKISTHIVVPSAMVKKLMVEKEQVKPEKIKVIHHGLPLEEFQQVSPERISLLREKYLGRRKAQPVVGVISRFMHLKGIQYIIPAFKELLKEKEFAHLILANARGSYAGEIRKLLSDIPSDSYTLIDFEKDAPALYRLFDVFVHVPIHSETESFGQVYLEALASGIPSVFTLSGIAPEFIQDRINALVVDFKSSHSILEAIRWILNNPQQVRIITERGKKDVFTKFHSSNMISNLEEYFHSILSEHLD